MLRVDVLVGTFLVRLFIVAFHDVDRVVNPLLPQLKICDGSGTPKHLSRLLLRLLQRLIIDVFLLVWRGVFKYVEFVCFI